MKYIVELDNGSKYELNQVWWQRWLYDTNGSFVISWSADDNPVYIKKSRIVSGVKLGCTTQEIEQIKKGEK